MQPLSTRAINQTAVGWGAEIDKRVQKATGQLLCGAWRDELVWTEKHSVGSR